MKNISRYLIVIFLCCIVLLSGSVALGSEPITTVLDNGMTVVLKENHAAPVVSLRIYVKAGSIYEREYLGTGVSHILEHLMFSGTETRTRQQIDREMEEIGNVKNAGTSKGYTLYYITTARSYFDTALELLADISQNPSFPEEEVESERGVIINEINMGKDEVGWRLSELFSRTMFRKLPARHPIIGYREQFEKLTRDDIASYFKRMYVPNNMVFVSVGDFDAAETLEKVKAAFKDFPRGPQPDLSLPDEPGQVSKRYAEDEMDIQIAYMMMGFRTVDIAHKDLYPLDVMAFIMGEGRSSRLYKRIKDEKQLVYYVAASSHTPDYKDGGYFGIMALPVPGGQQAAEKAILEEIYRLKTEYVTDEELEKARALKESEYIFMQETVEDQASVLGMDVISTGDVNFGERYLEGIRAVTKEDIMRVANEYFYDDNLTVAVVKPRSGLGMAAEQPAEAEAEAQVHKTVLDNGMILLVKESRSVPIVSIRALFKGGVRFEAEDKSGISNFMADMLIKGTKSRTAQQISEELESVGGSIGAFSGNNSFGASVSVLKRDLDKGLDILSDVVMNPIFDAGEMEKKRKEILAGIRQQEDDPFNLAAKLCRETLFQKHPYKFQTIGTTETITGMTREDLADFHQKYCIPNNMVFAVFGDVDGAEVVQKVKDAFAGFEQKELSPPEIVAEEPLTSIKEAEMQKDIKQLVIFMAFPGMTVQSEDIDAVEVMDAIMSGAGHPGGRLHERLRESQIVYVVHAYNQPGLDPGLFAVYAGTTPDKMDAAMSIIKEEINRIQADPVPDEEMARAKKMCISEKQIGLQTNNDQAFTMGLDELYGLGYDRMSKYEDRINAITKEDVMRVASKYLDLSKYAIAIVKPLEATEGQ